MSIPGRPRTPVVTSSPVNILHSANNYNLSWSTDTYSPILHYYLYYRKSEVRDYN